MSGESDQVCCPPAIAALVFSSPLHANLPYLLFPPLTCTLLNSLLSSTPYSPQLLTLFSPSTSPVLCQYFGSTLALLSPYSARPCEWQKSGIAIDVYFMPTNGLYECVIHEKCLRLKKLSFYSSFYSSSSLCLLFLFDKSQYSLT